MSAVQLFAAIAAAASVRVAQAIAWGRGWNLGNTCEAPTEGSWAPAAQAYFFDDVKAAGFTSVRIPVRWDSHTLTSPPYTVNATWLARVKQIVDWGIAMNLTTLINSHHDDWLDNSTQFEAMLPRFRAIWTQIAATFAGYPDDRLVFEVFNEPHVMTVAQLNAMNKAVLNILRSDPGLHPTRTVFLGGLQWMSIRWLAANPDALTLPTLADGSQDPHLAVEVHDYDPRPFTTKPFSVTTWGSAADVAAMQQAVDNATSWASYKRPAGTPALPLLLGEFACAVGQTDTKARLLWYKTFSSMVEAARGQAGDGNSGVASGHATTSTPGRQRVSSAAGGGYFLGWTIWDDDAGFRTYDRANRTWDEGVLHALGLH